ncbi:MAG: hypothetical protein WBA51_19415 [Erythrobacter sp.]
MRIRSLLAKGFRIGACGIAALLVTTPASAQPEPARTIVDASPPSDLSVTIYRDPQRGTGGELSRDNPQGFAMISEIRTVTLPQGESIIRFEGVAEGMVGVSAIVTGLPGGTIEKNRNAELLSPAALVNGALGNRVTITRTNPATGTSQSQQAIVRTRADGGLVLQTDAGFEAVRCAGLPEKLTFDGVPKGLSAKPVFSVNTRSDTGGTYEVTLTYLSWGFDWQANYVAMLDEGQIGRDFRMRWLSWLTLVNDNGQSFDDARLQIIAGTLNIESNFQRLSDPPRAAPLRLTCYPIGSTAAGSPIPVLREERLYAPAPSPMAMEADMITVTASRIQKRSNESAGSARVVTAEEENLGDLKLYRVPKRVDVSAKGMKQVAFLNKQAVLGRYLYVASCDPYEWVDEIDEPRSSDILLVTKNEEGKGLGLALPQGEMTVFEPTSRGPQLAARTDLRDFARREDIELELGQSARVFTRCARRDENDYDDDGKKWTVMTAELTNANPHEVKVRIELGRSTDISAKFPRKNVRVKNGERIVEVTIPANSTSKYRWKLRPSGAS